MVLERMSLQYYRAKNDISECPSSLPTQMVLWEFQVETHLRAEPLLLTKQPLGFLSGLLVLFKACMKPL